jgi:hypothetical protein
MCGCLFIFFGAAFPRAALVLLELFTNWNDKAFSSFWEGFIGFLFLPYTTLAFVLMTEWQDPVNGFGWFVVALGFIADITNYSGTYSKRRTITTG